MAAERHLSDGQLVRALDGEGSAAEARAWDDHLARCGRCADAMARLRSESRTVTDWLDRAAFEAMAVAGQDIGPGGRRSPPGTAAVPGRDRRVAASPWLRAAAILVLLAAPVAAIPAARSWVVATVLGPAGPAGPTAPSTAVAPATARPTVRFVPTPGSFVVRCNAGAAGTLALARTDGAEAELTGVDNRADAMVSASLLQLHDGAGRYQLRLPAAVTEVEVVIGDRTVRVDATGLDRGTVVDLAGD